MIEVFGGDNDWIFGDAARYDDVVWSWFGYENEAAWVEDGSPRLGYDGPDRFLIYGDGDIEVVEPPSLWEDRPEPDDLIDDSPRNDFLARWNESQEGNARIGRAYDNLEDDPFDGMDTRRAEDDRPDAGARGFDDPRESVDELLTRLEDEEVSSDAPMPRGALAGPSEPGGPRRDDIPDSSTIQGPVGVDAEGMRVILQHSLGFEQMSNQLPEQVFNDIRDAGLTEGINSLDDLFFDMDAEPHGRWSVWASNANSEMGDRDLFLGLLEYDMRRFYRVSPEEYQQMRNNPDLSDLDDGDAFESSGALFEDDTFEGMDTRNAEDDLDDPLSALDELEEQMVEDGLRDPEFEARREEFQQREGESPEDYIARLDEAGFTDEEIESFRPGTGVASAAPDPDADLGGVGLDSLMGDDIPQSNISAPPLQQTVDSVFDVPQNTPPGPNPIPPENVERFIQHQNDATMYHRGAYALSVEGHQGEIVMEHHHGRMGEWNITFREWQEMGEPLLVQQGQDRLLRDRETGEDELVNSNVDIYELYNLRRPGEQYQVRRYDSVDELDEPHRIFEWIESRDNIESWGDPPPILLEEGYYRSFVNRETGEQVLVRRLPHYDGGEVLTDEWYNGIARALFQGDRFANDDFLTTGLAPAVMRVEGWLRPYYIREWGITPEQYDSMNRPLLVVDGPNRLFYDSIAGEDVPSTTVRGHLNERPANGQNHVPIEAPTDDMIGEGSDSLIQLNTESSYRDWIQQQIDQDDGDPFEGMDTRNAEDDLDDPVSALDELEEQMVEDGLRDPEFEARREEFQQREGESTADYIARLDAAGFTEAEIEAFRPGTVSGARSGRERGVGGTGTEDRPPPLVDPDTLDFGNSQNLTSEQEQAGYSLLESLGIHVDDLDGPEIGGPSSDIYHVGVFRGIEDSSPSLTDSLTELAERRGDIPLVENGGAIRLGADVVAIYPPSGEYEIGEWRGVRENNQHDVIFETASGRSYQVNELAAAVNYEDAESGLAQIAEGRVPENPDRGEVEQTTRVVAELSNEARFGDVEGILGRRTGDIRTAIAGRSIDELVEEVDEHFRGRTELREEIMARGGNWNEMIDGIRREELDDPFEGLPPLDSHDYRTEFIELLEGPEGQNAVRRFIRAEQERRGEEVTVPDPDGEDDPFEGMDTRRAEDDLEDEPQSLDEFLEELERTLDENEEAPEGIGVVPSAGNEPRRTPSPSSSPPPPSLEPDSESESIYDSAPAPNLPYDFETSVELPPPDPEMPEYVNTGQVPTQSVRSQTAIDRYFTEWGITGRIWHELGEPPLRVDNLQRYIEMPDGDVHVTTFREDTREGEPLSMDLLTGIVGEFGGPITITSELGELLSEHEIDVGPFLHSILRPSPSGLEGLFQGQYVFPNEMAGDQVQQALEFAMSRTPFTTDEILEALGAIEDDVVHGIRNNTPSHIETYVHEHYEDELTRLADETGLSYDELHILLAPDDDLLSVVAGNSREALVDEVERLLRSMGPDGLIDELRYIGVSHIDPGLAQTLLEMIRQSGLLESTSLEDLDFGIETEDYSGRQSVWVYDANSPDETELLLGVINEDDDTLYFMDLFEWQETQMTEEQWMEENDFETDE